MWYSTNYIGKVKITPKMDIEMLNDIEEVLNKSEYDTGWNLELTKDRQYIEWKGNEKTYGFEDSLNFVIKQMREKYPTFDLEWEFKYQGEDMDDRGYIKKQDGKFIRVPITELIEWECKCPDCGFIFNLEK